MADYFNYLATQLISVRETYPSKSYPSLGLLPQLYEQGARPVFLRAGGFKIDCHK